MRPRSLAVFDVDGTLVRSVKLDEMCFVRAFAEVLRIDDIDTDWARYDHATDSSVTEQIVRERFGRDPRSDEIVAVRARYVALLREAAGGADGYRPVAGAPEMLKRLTGESWAAALATGGWRASTLVKLEGAGLDVAHLPAAFSEDGPSREGIVGAAIERARERHGVEAFARIVSVGDGVWDVRAAARLGCAFVGVGERERAARLRAEGASHVVADFVDESRVLKALEEAAPPMSG